jgi:TolB-like protein
MTPEAAALGAHQAQVASVIATVGIQAHLADASTHNIVWADSYSYEGLDLPSTLEAVVGALTRSLKRSVPHMNKTKPS